MGLISHSFKEYIDAYRASMTPVERFMYDWQVEAMTGITLYGQYMTDMTDIEDRLVAAIVEQAG